MTIHRAPRCTFMTTRIAILMMTACGMIAVLDVAAAQDYGSMGKPTTLAPAEPGVREFYIATVHLDGKTSEKGDASHPPEPYPKQALPAGGGLVLTPPDATGAWNMRAFVFQPSHLVVQAGDRIVLHFIGVHGSRHRIAIDGQSQVLELSRGTTATAEISSAKPGLIRFVSLDRQPSMRGEILVLPKP